jgi:hypothetical protein
MTAGTHARLMTWCRILQELLEEIGDGILRPVTPAGRPGVSDGAETAFALTYQRILLFHSLTKSDPWKALAMAVVKETLKAAPQVGFKDVWDRMLILMPMLMFH